MTFRKTLTAVVLAGCALLLAACGQPSGESGGGADERTFQWKMVTTWPKNYPGLGTGAEFFASEVARMSNNRLRIRVYGAGEMVPAMEVFDTVSQGTAEVGHSASYYWRGKLPVADLFTSTPFVLNAQQMNAWFHYGGGLELWREAYEPFNLVPFAVGNTGVQMAGWFNREINSLADLRGLKMRIPGLGGEVLARLGVETINIPGGELYTAMQTGVIEAVEWVGPYTDQAFGMHQVAKYLYYPGWQEPGAGTEIIVNKTALEQLPADLQAIVEVAARATNQRILDEFTARNATSLRDLVENHGIELRRLPDDVLIELRKTSDATLDDLVARDPLARRVLESQRAFHDSALPYYEVTEAAMYEATLLTNRAVADED